MVQRIIGFIQLISGNGIGMDPKIVKRMVLLFDSKMGLIWAQNLINNSVHEGTANFWGNVRDHFCAHICLATIFSCYMPKNRLPHWPMFVLKFETIFGPIFLPKYGNQNILRYFLGSFKSSLCQSTSPLFHLSLFQILQQNKKNLRTFQQKFKIITKC